MSVSFNQIPGNLRVPFAWFEVNPSQSPYQSISRLLLIGQMTAAGTATPNQPVWVTGGSDGLFGQGSMLSSMYQLAAAAAPFQEIWALPLSDAGGATKAAGTISLPNQAPIANAGTLVLYINGQRIAVPVSPFLTNTQIAQALVAAINACPLTQTTATTAAGVAASHTLTITMSAIGGSGATIPVTVNGIAYSVAVGPTDTASTIAANIAAAVQANSGVSATAVGAVITFTALSTGVWGNSVTVITQPATVGTNVTTTLASGTNDTVTVTATNAGTLGNGIAILTRLNQDDGPLADQLLSLTQPTGGAGDPSITTALTNLGDGLFDFIAMPYCQSYPLSQIEAWLANRWSPNSMTYGLNFTAMVGQTAGQVTAFTATRNSQYTYIMPMYGSPQSAANIAAVYAAVAAVHLQTPPELSRPLQTLPLTGILPPKYIGQYWSIPQRQAFYYSGAGAYVVQPGHVVAIDRAVSTYTLDVYGNPDSSWLDVNTLAQLTYGIRYIKQYISEMYPRCALVNTNPNNLQNFVTVLDIKNALIHAYSALVDLGVFDDLATFSTMVIVERNQQDPTRVDTFLPLEAVAALRVFAANATSYLQYPSN